jgi:serine O-acetyltransferase
MRQDVSCVVERDPAARARWEVALLYPGLHALWAHRASHWLWQHHAYFLARASSQAARWATGIEIHPAAQMGDAVFIDHGAGVVIGETAVVGNDVTIYHGVTLGGTGSQHGKRHPTIGDRVTLGAGAKILGDVTVGDDSRVGANAVLVRSVGNRSVVVGVPGQVISSSRPNGKRREPPDANTPQPDPIADTLQTLLRRVGQLENQLTGQSEHSALQMNSAGVWETDDFSI